MGFPFYLIDAFTDRAFSGNPAGVCVHFGELSDEWMRLFAMEMNQAETAFVSPRAEGFDLRWFTPSNEVDLCGHATLASAHALWSTGRVDQNDVIRFHTRSGILTAELIGEEIQLDFPVLEVTASEDTSNVRELFPDAVFIGKTGSGMDWFVELSSAESVRAVSADMRAIAAAGLRGLIVTARAQETDFISRFFAPQSGVPEDAVTGSAHCALAHYWSKKNGKTVMRGYQASGRGGYVGVTLLDSRVLLRGKAKTIVSGEAHHEGQ